MKEAFLGWEAVGARLMRIAEAAHAAADEPVQAAGWRLNDGQCASLRAIAGRLPGNGLIIADEVGMGKTRIAVAVARAVIECGGRVAILVPPGLGYQWGAELRDGDVQSPMLLRRACSHYRFEVMLRRWKSPKPNSNRSNIACRANEAM